MGVIGLYIAVPLPLALSSILILVVDLGFDLILALSYAWDEPENASCSILKQ